MISIRAISAVTLLALLVVFPAGAFPVSRDATDCGQTVGGVQICLASSGSALELAVRNVGERDVTLNLGIMMANGKVQLPNRLVMRFTDARGQTRLFQFADIRHL